MYTTLNIPAIDNVSPEEVETTMNSDNSRRTPAERQRIVCTCFAPSDGRHGNQRRARLLQGSYLV